jgi:hypothetical protein
MRSAVRLRLVAGGSVICALILAATAASAFVAMGVAFDYGVVNLARGDFEVVWKRDEWSWGFQTGVGFELIEPGFRWGRPMLCETGLLGAQGWKTRDWQLIIPSWLPLAIFALPTAVLWWQAYLAHDVSRRQIGAAARKTLTAAVASALGFGVAVGLSALLTRVWDGSTLTNMLVGVIVPFLAGGAAGVFALRFGSRRIATHEEGRCKTCGYDLTGNVSRRCPECGTDLPPSAERKG